MYDKQITELLPIIKIIAKKYANYNLNNIEYEDLVQEGIIGVVKAIKHFNPQKKVKFSSYAIWWIKQSIFDAINKYAKIIHRPFGKINLEKKIKQVRDIYINTFHREPTSEEIKKELQLSEEEFLHTIKINEPIFSIDKYIDDNESTTFKEFIKEDNIVNILEKEDLKKSINEGLKILEKRERFIIESFFGLNNSERKNLDEIGKILNLTRERCRQIKNEALKKIKKIIQKHYFT